MRAQFLPHVAPLALALLCNVGCASRSSLPVLERLSARQETPEAKQAKAHAPQAHAHALNLAAQADAAYEREQLEMAQILGEHALTAHDHAAILGRLSRARRTAISTNAALKQDRQTLANLEKQLLLLSAEAKDIEFRALIDENRIPVLTRDTTDKSRQNARSKSAHHLITQARLLCASAKVLDAKNDSVAKHQTELNSLSRDLQAAEKDAMELPMDRAYNLRTDCLSALSKIRRPHTAKTLAELPESLFKGLSERALHPVRDDRGVVVTLGKLFKPDGSLAVETETTLSELAQIAKAHPEFPLLVVFQSTGSGSGFDANGKASLIKLLVSNGAPRVEHTDAIVQGPTSGVLGQSDENQAKKLELVFVSPVR